MQKRIDQNHFALLPIGEMKQLALQQLRLQMHPAEELLPLRFKNRGLHSAMADFKGVNLLHPLA